MQKISLTSALEVFILDLLYLFARLDANPETKPFAPPVKAMHDALEETDRALRDAHKAQVLAQAVRDHEDDQLDQQVKSAGKLTEATFGSQQKPEFKRVFRIAPSTVARLTWSEEIETVKVIANQLETSGNPTLVALAAPLRERADALAAALTTYKDSFTPLATVRGDRDYQKAESNVLRDKVYGQLIATFPGERNRVERFFRDADGGNRSSQKKTSDEATTEEDAA